MPRIDVGTSEQNEILWFRISSTGRRSLSNGKYKLEIKYGIKLDNYNEHGPYRVSFNGSGNFWEYIYTVKGYKYS